MNLFVLVVAIISFALCTYASAFMSSSGDQKRRNKSLLMSLISIAFLALSGSYLIY